MTDLAEMIRLRMIVNQTFKGGEGSGNFGHAGRPGEVGGSAGESSGNASDGSTKDETGDKVTASTWGVSIDSTKQELENAGYIPIFRGTGAEGVKNIRPSETGQMGKGAYFYTSPKAAAAYAERGGGIVAAYINPFDAEVLSNVPGRDYQLVKISNIGAIIRRGVIPVQETIGNVNLDKLADNALNKVWEGYNL